LRRLQTPLTPGEENSIVSRRTKIENRQVWLARFRDYSQVPGERSALMVLSPGDRRLPSRDQP